MPIINITVRDKIAYREEDSLPFIVSGNSDYVVAFDFDGEWEEYKTKTARFIMGGGYTDVVFDGVECAIPTLRGGGVLEVGVYAGDIHTTTPAEIGVKPCVTSGGVENAPPTPDIYAQIMEKLNELGSGVSEDEVNKAVAEALKGAIPTTLPNPNPLSVNGVEYDGSKAIDITVKGCADIDVAASVGQTIVVKEVDANGKPTSWESANYQPRTHYSEMGELFSETTLTLEDGGVVVPADFVFTVGETYKVKYNGTEYDCTAFEFVGEEGVSVVGVGNGSAFGEYEDTGEPFFAFTADGIITIIAMEEITEIVIGIKGTKIVTIPSKYLPEVGTYYVDITEEDNTYTTTLTPNQFAELMKSGRSVFAKVTTVNNGATVSSFIPLTGTSGSGGLEYFIIYFNGVDYTGINKKQFMFIVDMSSDDNLNVPYVMIND